MGPASIAPGLWPQVAPIILLVCSNVFMTLAWYGHLKFKSVPLVTVVLVSWGIAFVKYCFAVPANRIGSAGLFAGGAEDHAGGDHADRVRGLHGGLFQGAAELRAGRGLRTDRPWRDPRISRPGLRLQAGARVMNLSGESLWGGPPDGAVNRPEAVLKA